MFNGRFKYIFSSLKVRRFSNMKYATVAVGSSFILATSFLTTPQYRSNTNTSQNRQRVVRAESEQHKSSGNDLLNDDKSTSFQSKFKSKFSLGDFMRAQKTPIRAQLLPDAPSNGKYDGNKVYTVVLNLEKTLMCSTYSREKGWTHAKRPCVDQFLLALAQMGYEIVVFSTENKGYVQGMVGSIDTRQVVSHQLFREHTSYIDGVHVKDIKYLGRDLSNVILIDSNTESLKHSPENGIFVSKYEQDDRNDRELCKLIPFFKHLKRQSIDDVRDVIRNYDMFNRIAQQKELELSRHYNNRAQSQKEGDENSKKAENSDGDSGQFSWLQGGSNSKKTDEEKEKKN